MTTIQVGKKAPSFTLPGNDGKNHSLSDFLGKKVLLYFYPKDDTPGCTTEACAFRDSKEAYEKMGIEIIGVSADSVKKHQSFAQKYDLPFLLLADESKEVVNAYGVWGKKKFMGREYEGIFRQSFLIDEEGNIARIYEKVDPKVHAEEVLSHI